jgi:flagellar basal body-associated protein FliL
LFDYAQQQDRAHPRRSVGSLIVAVIIVFTILTLVVVTLIWLP